MRREDEKRRKREEIFLLKKQIKKQIGMLLLELRWLLLWQ